MTLVTDRNRNLALTHAFMGAALIASPFLMLHFNGDPDASLAAGLLSVNGFKITTLGGMLGVGIAAAKQNLPAVKERTLIAGAFLAGEAIASIACIKMFAPDIERINQTMERRVVEAERRLEGIQPTAEPPVYEVRPPTIAQP